MFSAADLAQSVLDRGRLPPAPPASLPPASLPPASSSDSASPPPPPPTVPMASTPPTVSFSGIQPVSQSSQSQPPSQASAPSSALSTAFQPPLVSSQHPSHHPWQIDRIPAVCITLERRTDRWKRFQSQPALESLSVKRFLGVDGKTLDLLSDSRVATLTKRNIVTKSRRSHEELDSIGGVGCALSHIAVWQWMVDQQHELCLVFEDDAVVPADFVPRANQVIRSSDLLQHPMQWEMWLLGGLWDDTSSIPNETKKSGVIRIGSSVLFHAYVLTLPMAKRLLEDVYPIHSHIDMWVSIYSFLYDLRLVGTPALRLEQNQKTKTDIQQEEGCAICNVPTDFSATHLLVPKWQWRMGQVAGVLVAGVAVYAAVKWWRLPSSPALPSVPKPL